MKKILISSTILAAFIGGVVSCNNDKDDNIISTDPVEIVINSGLSTKAVDTRWEAGDAIGVTVYNPDTTVIINGQFNREYITQTNGENGIFNAVDGSNLVYFPQDGSSIRLKAYYPYRANLGTNWLYPVDVSDQLVLQDIDLMTAVHMTGFSRTDNNVWVHFYHRLSKLIFNLSIDNNGSVVNLSNTNLTITGMQLGNTYDIFVNDFLTQYTGIGNIVVPLRTGESSAQRQAIVLPRAAGTGVTFVFTTSTGDTYTAAMPSDLELESGNKYIFNIILSNNPIADISVTIEPWIENEPINIVGQ